MSGILSSLLMSAGALKAFDQSMGVTQNNVANASTPGYVKQTQMLAAMPFDISMGALGGVRVGDVSSARDQFAEQAVWRQSSLLGQAQQDVSSLTSLQSNFDISGDTGIPSALNSLFQSFSAWGQTPNDANARQNVILRATDVANAFQQTASGLATATSDNSVQLQQTVNQVNQLVGQLAGYNLQIEHGDRHDAGLDAQLYSTLQQLSQYVSFSGIKQADGTVTVLLEGQTPLLIGGQQYQIQFSPQTSTDPDAPFPNGPATARILGADGADVTSTVTTGQLGSLLHIRNDILPQYVGSSTTAGDLNTMAKQFADTVNAMLVSGTQADGTPGVPLFKYDTTNGTHVAQTLAVDPTVTGSHLAANSPGPPAISNGIALALAGMANPHDASAEINGESFTAYFGDMATRVGAKLNAATSQQQVQQSAVAQAQNLREQASGVSLDEEAMLLVEFQRAYEANSRMITVLNQLTQDTINILN